MSATEGQPGYGLIQWQRITKLMSEWLCMYQGYLRVCVCVSMCICMHECVGRAGEHVYEVFQYSEAVRFLKGDSSSTQTEGKCEKYGAPSKIKPRKSTLHVTWTVSCLEDTDIYSTVHKVSAHLLTIHCLFFLCAHSKCLHLFFFISSCLTLIQPQLLFNYSDTSFAIFRPSICLSLPLLSMCKSLLSFLRLYFYLPTLFFTSFHYLSLTSRPLVACLSIFHPWVPLELKKTHKTANCNRRQ